MIEFSDEPVFGSFVLPDSLHIDGADVPRFTFALAQTLAQKKLVCPVTKAAIGSMGNPVSLHVNDTTVKFCCGACP